MVNCIKVDLDVRYHAGSPEAYRTKPAASISAKKRRLRWWRGSDPGRPVAPEPEATGRGSEETSASSSALIRIRRGFSFFPSPEVSSLSLASHGVHCTGALACARLRSTRARLATASTAAAVACAVDIARRLRRGGSSGGGGSGGGGGGVAGDAAGRDLGRHLSGPSRE